MNKKGFVLLETIVVLVITVVCMLGLFLTYSFVIENLKQARYYDNIGDVYKLNVLYSILDKDSVSNINNYEIITSANCSSYFENNCADLIDSRLKFNYLIITTADINSILASHNSDLKPSDINYFKTLENGYTYLIGFYNNGYQLEGNNYYVSLKVGE